MKKSVLSIAVVFVFSMQGAHAAVPCRSAVAAAQGSQTAYQKDVQAAQQTAQDARNASDIIGKCVGSITGVMTMPQFPSLDSIWQSIKNQVCQIASNNINGAIGAVNQQINGSMSGINQGINNGIGNIGIGGGSGTIHVPPLVPPISGPVIQPTHPNLTTNQGTQTATFWSNIWR